MTAWLSVRKAKAFGDLLMKQGVVPAPKKGRTKNDQIKINALEFVMQGKGGVVGENVKIGAIVLNHEFEHPHAFLPPVEG